MGTSLDCEKQVRFPKDENGNASKNDNNETVIDFFLLNTAWGSGSVLGSLCPASGITSPPTQIPSCAFPFANVETGCGVVLMGLWSKDAHNSGLWQVTWGSCEDAEFNSTGLGWVLRVWLLTCPKGCSPYHQRRVRKVWNRSRGWYRIPGMSSHVLGWPRIKTPA